MIVPDNLVKLGIYQIIFEFNDYPDLSVYVHEQGLLFTDMPDSSPRVTNVMNGFSIPVGHEIVKLQKYNGKMCTNDPNYRLDECRLEYISKVCRNYFFH